MTSGTRLNAISIQLGLLEKNIKQESLRLISQGVRPAVDDPGYHAFFRQLQQWSSQMELILRRLGSIKHEIALSREQVKRVPRGQRYRAQQSVSDREKHLQKIENDANGAAAHLTRLYQLALTPTGVDIQRGVFQMVEGALDARANFAELEKLSLKQSSASATATVMKARQALQVSRPDVPDALTVLVLVMQLLRIWWLEKLRQGSRK